MIEITKKHTLNEHTKEELEIYCFKNNMITIQSIHFFNALDFNKKKLDINFM